MNHIDSKNKKKFKTIFFPGWAMPPDRQIAENILPQECSPLTVCDYGFFNASAQFDFENIDAELAKFAEDDYEIVVGYSLGSQLALRMASHYCGKKLKALILICAFAKFAKSLDNPEGQKRSAIRAMINGMCTNPSNVLKNFYQLVFGSIKSGFNSNSLIPNPSKMVDGLKFLLNCDASQCINSIKVPSLVIAGSDDVLVSPALSKKLSESLSNSQFVLLEGKSHSIPFTEWEALRKISNEFLKKNIF